MKINELSNALDCNEPELEVMISNGIIKYAITEAVIEEDDSSEKQQMIIYMEGSVPNTKVLVMRYWLSTRSPYPKKDDMTGNVYIDDCLTSQEIVDQLQEMCPLDVATVSQAMLSAGFTMTTLDDGSIRWLIYRNYFPII